MTVSFKFIETADMEPFSLVKLVKLARGAVKFSAVQD